MVIGHHFIWTDCVLSPDEKRLAIDGCHWACPYEIRIFDVSSDPPAFPLRELAVFPLVGGRLRWIDNETIGEFKEYQELSRHILGEFSPWKTLRTWQAWGDTDGGITFVPTERIPQLRKAGILNDQAELRHTVTSINKSLQLLDKRNLSIGFILEITGSKQYVFHLIHARTLGDSTTESLRSVARNFGGAIREPASWETHKRRRSSRKTHFEELLTQRHEAIQSNIRQNVALPLLDFFRTLCHTQRSVGIFSTELLQEPLLAETANEFSGSN